MSIALKEHALTLLDLVTVSFAATGQTTLYTVPASITTNGTTTTVAGMYLCFLKVKAGADAGATTVTVGKSTALTDYLGTQTLSNLDAENDVVTLMPVPNATPVKEKWYAAGTVVQMDVTAAEGGATNTVGVFGILEAA